MASSDGHLADALEGRDLLQAGLGELLPRLRRAPLAPSQLAIALLEHVRALVQLLVALEQAALQVGQLAALGAGLLLAPLAARRTCSSLAWRMSSFCWARASATMRAGLVLAARTVCVATDAARHESDTETGNDGNEGHHRHYDGIAHIRLPPIRPLTGRMCAGSLGRG